MKKILVCATLLLMLVSPVRAETFVIDATKNAIAHNEKGLFFMRLKYYPAAINEFTLAIALNPDSELTAVCYNNLGQAYMQIGYYDAAEKCFKNAVELKPYNIVYTENLIRISTKRNKTGSLKSKYEKMHLKDANSLQPYLMLGLIHKNMGNTGSAEGYLSEFVRLAPHLDITNEVRAVLKDLHGN